MHLPAAQSGHVVFLVAVLEQLVRERPETARATMRIVFMMFVTVVFS